MFNNLYYGDFFYAAVTRHFGQDVAKEEEENEDDAELGYEARVHDCTFGVLATYVRTKPKKERNYTFDWSKVGF